MIARRVTHIPHLPPEGEPRNDTFAVSGDEWSGTFWGGYGLAGGESLGVPWTVYNQRGGGWVAMVGDGGRCVYSHKVARLLGAMTWIRDRINAA